MVIRKRRDSIYSNMCWLFLGRPRLCFAVNEILPLLNYHRKRFRGCMICLCKRKIISLLYDLSLKRKNASLYDMSLERKNAFVAV